MVSVDNEFHDMFEVLVLAFALVPFWDFIGHSTLLELGQGFGLAYDIRSLLLM